MAKKSGSSSAKAPKNKASQKVLTSSGRAKPSAKTKQNLPATKAKKMEALNLKTALNQGQFIKTVAERSEVEEKTVQQVLRVIQEVIVAHLKKKGPQKFKWSGLLMMKLKTKLATKVKKGINPFTKEPMTIAAKPARQTVRITALKALKEAL